jgi:hypothetical protein
VLTKDHFDTLLAWLDPSRELAAEAYEEIRQKLITFYYNNDLREAEACADETLDRVAENIEEKKIMRVGNPQPYFLGFARNILKGLLFGAVFPSNRSILPKLQILCNTLKLWLNIYR